MISLVTVQAGLSQDQRTFETKVADALNLLPVSNQETYKKTMQELVNLGPQVVDELTRLYNDSEGKERAQLELAFSGIGKFLSSASKGVRSQFAEAFVESVSDHPAGELPVALLEELSFFMPEDQVSLLKPLLAERNLQMRIMDILEMRPSETSGAIIWSAMDKADNRTRFKIYKVLADPRFGMQDRVLNPSMANSQGTLGQLILNGLAESGDVKFVDYFVDLAANDPDPVELDAIIKFGHSLAENGKQEEAVRYLKNILKNENQKLQALGTYQLARVAPDKAIAEVKAAFASGHEESAVAAAHALSFINSGQYDALVSSIEKSTPAARADAIRVLTRQAWAGSEDLVRSGMKSSDTLVAAQAVIGVAELHGTGAQNDVLDFLQSTSNTAVKNAAVTALKMSTDKKNINQVVSVLSNVDDATKIQLIPIVADRGDERYFDNVYKYASEADGQLQQVAIRSLGKLGASKNIPQVLDLLNNVSEDQVKVTQSTLDKMLSKSSGTEWEPQLLASIEGSNKNNFIPLIGHLSGDKPSMMAKKILNGNDVAATNQLLTTVGEWADPTLVKDVMRLLENEEVYDNALKAALSIIDRADWSDVRKILYLQQLYDQVKYSTNKVEIIGKIGSYRDYYALLTIGDYLENTTGSVQNAAAKGIMSVVMPGPQNDDGLKDSLALDLLEQAREIVSGPDSEYFKENIKTYIESVPAEDRKGFVSMFNGENLAGWQGFVANPIQLSRMSDKEIEEKQQASNKRMRDHWWVENGEIHFKGDGQNLVSAKNYENFVMLIDWRIGDKGDSGVYLRGTPQVQIWDTARVDVGAEVGSGGLYNNQKHPSKPSKLADMGIGDWNHMKMSMMGEKVSVWLNGDLVVDDVVLENYWDRSIPIFPSGPIELQAHGTDIAFRKIYVKEIPSGMDLLTKEEKEEGFTPLFNGYNLDGWTGNKVQYQAVNGVIVVDPEASGSSGNLFTEKQYADFNFRFEFMLTPGANNGLGVRAPLEGNAAYGGIELQILDNTASIYANLKPYQYHGSLYGVAPAERGYLKPVGEWNVQEVIVTGDRYQVILNGTKILDVDAKEAVKNGAMDGKEHPGLKRKKGHIGFLGHGSEVKFRNIRIKEL